MDMCIMHNVSAMRFIWSAAGDDRHEEGKKIMVYYVVSLIILGLNVLLNAWT